MHRVGEDKTGYDEKDIDAEASEPGHLPARRRDEMMNGDGERRHRPEIVHGGDIAGSDHRQLARHAASALAVRMRAGTPAATAPAATSCVTTAPAPMMAPSPIVTPLSTTAPAPIQTLSPITTGA